VTIIALIRPITCDGEALMRQHIEYDEDRIRQYIVGKQANEIELAWDLRDIFNIHEELVGPLRQLVSFAVDELDEMRRGPFEGHQIVTAAWKKEVTGPKNKALIKYGNLTKLANNIPYLSAEECSDCDTSHLCRHGLLLADLLSKDFIGRFSFM
jgi:hypothetical protein